MGGPELLGPSATSPPEPPGAHGCQVCRPPVAHCCRRCARSYLDIIEQAVSEGDTLLIENIGETVDPVLDPLLGRNTIKKGK